MIESLLNSLIEYKICMSYRNLDFDADKPLQYKELRYKMALKYEDEDLSLFGLSYSNFPKVALQ